MAAPCLFMEQVKTGNLWIVDAATAKTLANLYPLGQVVDEGDTLLQTRRLIKGRRK